jgi:hypothetical protein
MVSRIKKQSAVKIGNSCAKAAVYRAPVAETQEREKEEVEEVETTSKANNAQSTGDKIKKLFDRYVDKIKRFF